MKIKRVIAIAFALFVVFALCSCGASSRPDSVDSFTPSYSMKNTSAISTGESYYGGDSYSSDPQVYENETSDYSRKIIKHQNLYLETLEFDKGLEDIEILVGSYGGYYASSEVSTSGSTRRATLSLRIPSSKLDEFVSGITKSETFNIRSTSLSTEEVTETYYDLKAQLDSLMDQEARIKALMDRAATLSELLTIENKLTSVRTQINSVSSKIQYYDKAVDMSFVNITLYEVKEYIPDDPPTYFERVGEAIGGAWKVFASFVGDIFVGILWAFPFILVIGGILVVAIIVSRKRFKKKMAEKEKQKQIAEQNKE